MDRINGAGHVGHMFVSEDASISRPPTEITEGWLNGVQEEIVSVIEASGQVPDAGIFTQLLAALSLTGVFATAPDAENSTKVATTGWVRSAMASIATAAGFVISPAGNGYIKFPSWLGSWVFQWGQQVVGFGTLGSITLPTSFSVACYCALTSVANTSGGYACSVGTLGLSSIGAYHNVGVNQTINFIAIGK